MTVKYLLDIRGFSTAAQDTPDHAAMASWLLAK